ncbi:MAG: alpha/beta fold hydrolase [Chloroflexota bacterium]|nr:alpha/beta fold hydrolase [Chloroflexota bacterium]
MTPTTARAIIFVNGVASGAGYGNFQALLAQLGGRFAYYYSYRGGSWAGGQWTINPYGDSDTVQPLSVSVALLEDMIRGARRSGYGSVAVAGFSLGGLVAAQALAAPDPAGRPDRVVTLASPPQGINVHAKSVVGDRMKATAAMLGGITILTLGASGLTAGVAAAEAAAFVDLAIPSGPLNADMRALYFNPAVRQLPAIAASIQQGARLETIANVSDCLYWTAICASDLGSGDTDDRFSNHLGVPGETALNVNSGRFSWWWNIPKAHSAIMQDYAAMAQAAAFLTR